MHKDPLVSILIPAYNHENYIQNSILSIFNQTYKNIELIIVDDGSTDNTWGKINELKVQCKKRFFNLIFETKPNSGTCDTLNMLLKKSNGEYLYFFSSDDMLKPKAIEKEVAFLEKNQDYSLVVGDNEIIDGAGELCYWDKKNNNTYNKNKAKFLTFGALLKSSRKDVNFNSENFGSYASIFAGNYIPNGYLVRKSIFEKIGNFTKEAPLEDWWLHLQISKYSKLKYIDEILFSYRWHSSNTAKQKEKMRKITSSTINYEINLLNNLNLEECLDDVSVFIRDGIIFKTKGIKNIFQIIKIKTFTCQIKTFKLFGVTLFEMKKPY